MRMWNVRPTLTPLVATTYVDSHFETNSHFETEQMYTTWRKSFDSNDLRFSTDWHGGCNVVGSEERISTTPQRWGEQNLSVQKISIYHISVDVNKCTPIKGRIRDRIKGRKSAANPWHEQGYTLEWKGQLKGRKQMEYRIETTIGHVVAHARTKEEAIAICQQQDENAFVWDLIGRNVIYRNW